MKNKKIVFIVIFILVFVFSVIIPTFSRFKFKDTDISWDGLPSSGFKKGTGTLEDPYIISNANEFAFFALSTKEDDYDGKYIKLTGDIVINKGVFKEDSYILDDETYYLSNGKYYTDEALENEEGNILILPSIENFKGILDGDFHTIYGLYEDNEDVNSLFLNLSGELKNLYIDNAFINGGYITAGVAANADNAILKNIIFDGIVVGNTLKKEVSKTITIDDFEVLDTLNKKIDIPLISNVSSNVLTGTCSGTSEFILNGNTYACDEFEIEIANELEFEADNATFENLTYTLTYEENKTSGIVGNAISTIIDGVVNKGNVKGIYASGILGTSIDTNIKNSYNAGKVSGDRVSGITDTIMYSDSYLRYVYNNGQLLSDNKSGLVSKVYNSDLYIDKTFSTSPSYMIDDILLSNIEIENSYNVLEYLTNDFNELDFEEINSLYPKYIDDENVSNGNIWVGEELPILYFDDVKNKTVQVKVGNLTWDSLNADISEVRYDDEVEVLISTTDIYKPIKNVWYYLANDLVEDLESVNWTEYNGVFKLDNNVYILYVKYEDYNDNVYYINTDKLIIDFERSNVSISNGNTIWSEYHTPTNKFINQNITYQVLDNGTTDSISKIEYLVSDKALTKEELNDSEWITYNDPISISSDLYIVYVKVTDKDLYVTYLNTDMMVNMSYEITNLKSGNNLEFTSNMRYNSSMNFDISLNHLVGLNNYKRYIKVDKALPSNTIITLKSGNEYYQYVVDTSDYDSSLNSYLYPLSRLKKVGKIVFDEYFNDDDYNSLDSESYNIFIDFRNISNVTNNYSLSLIAKAGDVIKSNDNVSFSLIDTDTNKLSITSAFSNTINYGVQSINTIGLNLNLENILYNDINVLDTSLENLYEGISIEVYDTLGNMLSRDELKDLRFRYNNTIYVFDSNNRVNINLGKEKNKYVNLDIITFESNSNLNGTYYFKIRGYLSIDGINIKYPSYNYVTIPLLFTSNINNEYNFDVKITNPIIDKGSIINFDIDYTGMLENPNLRVSLYKKKELTAYNQEYILVDLKDYIDNNLEGIDNVYMIDLEDIIFNIKDDIDSNGYKFVFELYDGDNKVSNVTIKTIIR